MKNFPPAEALIELEPEEIGQYLLVYLNKIRIDEGRNKFHRYNETSGENSSVRQYAAQLNLQVSEVLAEAWMWLVAEGFLAPTPNENSNDWVRISRRGQKITSIEDFKQYEHIKLLPKKVLDPVLAQKIWASFIRGDFETAIFSAFKEVEIRLRGAAKLSPKDVGVDLARKAFHPDTGLLTDYNNPDRGERQSYSDLFAGALGTFKNPSSHRDVNYDDPVIATGLILHAHTLLQIIEQRRLNAEEVDAEHQKLQASA